MIEEKKYGPYDPSSCCGADCSSLDEECAGDVEVYDEFYDEENGECYWIHYCEFHWLGGF